jgi:hypothetical protein
MAAMSMVMARWYAAQILGITLLIGLGTYFTLALNRLPSPWNALWMVGLPIGTGLMLNNGTARVVMAGTLCIASWIAAGLVGAALRGM